MDGSPPEPIRRFDFTDHARQEMKRRGISEQVVIGVLSAPEQRESARPGRDILHGRYEVQGKQYLLRVFVDVDRTPAAVVTTYRTSKIGKYWRERS